MRGGEYNRWAQSSVRLRASAPISHLRQLLPPGEIAGVDAGEIGHAHEIFVYCAGGFAAFVDGPDDERLTAAQVAGGEDAFQAGHVVAAGLHVAARIELEAELLDRPALLGAQKAHGQEGE